MLVPEGVRLSCTCKELVEQMNIGPVHVPQKNIRGAAETILCSIICSIEERNSNFLIHILVQRANPI